MKSVAIIGAGPAGSVAAIVLARAGVPVTLIEQHRFPRDKVCGECLSAMGIQVLDRLGLSAALQRLRPVPLERASLFAADGSGAQVRLPRPMWGISRLVLDAFLLQAAREVGARVLQPARLEHNLRIRDLQTNQVESLSADCVLAGDGKAPRRTEDLGLKAHFRNVDAPPKTIALFGVPGHYGGIAPIEGGLWNVAFSIPAKRVTWFVTRASRPCKGRPHGRNARVTNEVLDHLFAMMQSENSALKHQMQGASRTTDWLVSPLPRFGVARRWPEGVIPIGNAAAAIEPIGGEGMGLAMRSAELAAQCLIEAIRRGVEPDLARLRSEYRRLWTMRGLACRLAGLAVSSPCLCRMILPFVDGEDALTDVALRALGKA